MTHEAPNGDRFEPLHAAHAIDQLAISVQFLAPVDPLTIRALVAAVKKQFNSDLLPGGSETQTIELAFGVGQPMPAPVMPRMTGYVFTRTRKDSTIEAELRIDQGSITFRTAAYTRWPQVWNEAREYFAALIPSYIAANAGGLAQWAVNFVDKFTWMGDLAACRARHVLRVESPYVCPHVYDADDLWHSHTGRFQRVNDRIKRLLNVNLDLLEQPQIDGLVRYLQVTTLVTDRLNQPGYAASTDLSAADATELAINGIEDMHEYSKSVFSRVIDDWMCKRIGLIE